MKLKIPDNVKAALRTALWSFIGLFAMSSLGWLQGVIAWASSSGRTPLPGLSILGFAVVAAATSSVIGLVNFVAVWAQGKGFLPGNPPSYSGGISDPPPATLVTTNIFSSDPATTNPNPAVTPGTVINPPPGD